MDIVEFFELSSGKWFSQRTSHYLISRQSEVGKSDIQIDLLVKTDPALLQLCERHNLDSGLVACGVRLTWNGTMESDQKKITGSVVLVPIADPENPAQGKLLRDTGGTGATLLAGRYAIGSDEALTLITEDETMYSEERLWFASPNLRFRSSVLKRSSGFSEASFCSEIRLGVSKPKTDAAPSTP
jgi:hypothetical protein